jgi:hypothetical protein
MMFKQLDAWKVVFNSVMNSFGLEGFVISQLSCHLVQSVLVQCNSVLF